MTASRRFCDEAVATGDLDAIGAHHFAAVRIAHQQVFAMGVAEVDDLKDLRQAHPVEPRREGKNVYYRLTSEVLAKLAENARELMSVGREELLAQAERGEVLVLDVRPESEFQAGHLPYAQSMPLEELHKRLAELPQDKPVVAYCRGPFCLMAVAAVELLRQEGFQAIRLDDGVAEWRATVSRW
jgi:rhodanese-related sulfurtransferase